MTCPEPVTYYRDVSFWVTDPDCFSEATLHYTLAKTPLVTAADAYLFNL